MLRSIYQWTATTSLTCTTFSSIWFAISIILINCGPGDTAKSVSLLLQIFHNWRSIRTSKEPPTHTFLGRPRIIYHRSIPRQNITQPGADHCKGLLVLHLNTAATLRHQNDNEALSTTLQWYQYQFFKPLSAFQIPHIRDLCCASSVHTLYHLNIFNWLEMSQHGKVYLMATHITLVKRHHHILI